MRCTVMELGSDVHNLTSRELCQHNRHFLTYPVQFCAVLLTAMKLNPTLCS
jgi:hypothetical protein